jgi:ectoine hydroxylase-related dioxygenase (phytanoyl-CoA dioxygenase family)
MRPNPLSPDDVAFYHDNGYLLYRKPVFAEDRFARLKAIFEEHFQARGETRGDDLHVPHFHDPRLLEFLLADEVLDLVEPLIGPDIALFSSHFIAKEPLIGRATPWHEDSAYWNGRFDRYDQIVTIWLAIDPTDAANGAMKVIPGTHRHGFSQYEAVDGTDHTFPEEIRAGSFDPSQAVTFELHPNECSLHDGRIIHGADANRSPRRRTGYTMRYIAQTMKFIPEGNPGHVIWHARGRNVAGNPVVNAADAGG